MRQAVAYRSRKKKRPSFRYFLLVLAVFALSIIFLLSEGVVPLQQAPTLAQAVSLQAGEAARHTAFTFRIDETGPGYNLEFLGQVQEDIVYGTLQKFNLQVLAQGDRYFVRGGELFEQWQPADKAELDDISIFVRNPLALLGSILQVSEAEVEKGPDTVIEGNPCHSYLLEIAPADIEPLTLISSVNKFELERFRVYLWFAENDQFLYKMALLFDIISGGERVAVSRVFTLSRETQALPLDLQREKPVEV